MDIRSRTDRRRAFLFSTLALITLLFSGTMPRSALAWYDHLVVMDWMRNRLEKEAPIPAGFAWDRPLPVPKDNPKEEYHSLASLLLLNPGASIRSLRETTPRSILRIAADDPDHGMDRELPDSADPNDDRTYMGGTIGTPSAGFRHMYWPGWNWRKPLATFQIPTRVLGQAPDRADLIANEAKERFRKGHPTWGFRLLGWAIHYLQDLTQPFHAAQVPSLRMVPWSALFAWPPSKGWAALVREATRTITNYHWAYEGYVRQALLQGNASPFRDCFDKNDGSLLVSSPRDLALEVTRQSINRSRAVGKGLLKLVGPYLKKKDISISLNPNQVDIGALLRDPTYQGVRDELNRETCESFRLATNATIWLVNWTLKSN
jgi:hypothetical protein